MGDEINLSNEPAVINNGDIDEGYPSEVSILKPVQSNNEITEGLFHSIPEGLEEEDGVLLATDTNFTILYLAYEAHLLAYLKKKVYGLGYIDNAAKLYAEDIRQDIFLTLWLTLKSPRLKIFAEDVNRWIFSTASNYVIDIYRKNNPQIVRYGLAGDIDKILANKTCISKIEDYTSTKLPSEILGITPHAVLKVLEDYKPHYVHIMSLRYIEGMTEREIVASLGIPLNTVKSVIHRAIAFLDNHYNNPKPVIQEISVDDIPFKIFFKWIGDFYPDYAQYIEMHYRNGQSYQEIAQMLNEPVGTIKSRVLRSIKRYKESLRNQVSYST